MEPPDVRAAAVADPRGFLAAHQSPLIIDEVQYAPDLISYIQAYGTDGANPIRSSREGLRDLSSGDSIGVSPHRPAPAAEKH